MSSNVDLRELAIDRAPAEGSKRRGRRHLFTRYVLPLALVLGFGALLLWASQSYLFPPKPVTVVPVFSTTAEVQMEGTPLFKASGWIEPRPTPIRVAALAPGVVEELLVVEDQPVKKGEPVAEMVKDDARLTHQRALADLQLREAELNEVKAGLKAAETRLDQPVHLEAALGEAEAALAKIKTELKNLPFALKRAKAEEVAAQSSYDAKVASKGVVAGVKIDLAKRDVDSAAALVQELSDREASLLSEEKALAGRRDALQTQLELLADETKAKEGADAKVKAAQARVEQARVMVAEAKLRLDRMTVVAPVDGRVFRLYAHPGTQVGGGVVHLPGSDGATVVTMYQPEKLQARVDVRFADIPNVSLGQQVEIDNAALPEPLTGRVLFISSEADIQKNTLEVKVEVPPEVEVFKPEMLVDVTFLAPKTDQDKQPPTEQMKIYTLQQLIHQGEGGSYVWVADQSDSVAHKVPVKTGQVGSNGLVEITSGLTITSRIISSGTDGLQDGDAIKISGEDAMLATGDSAGSGGQGSQQQESHTGAEHP